MIELFQFQSDAANLIADRFQRYVQAPVVIGRGQRERVVPFFQALSSVTASGKTVILADAVSTMAAVLPRAPVVIWLSRGKVVVEQTFANLLPGGRYNHILRQAEFRALGEFKPEHVASPTQPQIYFATVGTFNQKDKEEGSRIIYRSEIDTADTSTWDSLKNRLDADGIRRPLMVVYDEAHNLTDQQTELLMELEPLAFIVASATMRIPRRLKDEIDTLKRETGWSDSDLVVGIDTSAVVESGLIKSTVLFGGYEAPMEGTLQSLLADFAAANADAESLQLGWRPKAIYVCRTNIVEGDSYQRDDPRHPFPQRQAPPILIWRYLTEVGGIEPEEIAVYCSLAFVKDFPPPDQFVHFSGGDKDYAAFASGNYRHIIFNLSLQEGWDDPSVCFAYIDKSMESRASVEQTIGRVLRQPGVRHYPAPRLNSAHLYVRVDRKGVFADVVDKAAEKLRTEAPDVRLVVTAPGKAPPTELPPKEHREVLETAYDTSEAVQPIGDILASMSDYRADDGTNTRSVGSKALLQRRVGDDRDKGPLVWQEFEHTNLVSARWVFQREVRRRFAGALGVASTQLPAFDALVGFGSNAFVHIEQIAAQVVEAYTDNVFLKQRRLDPFVVGPAMVRVDEMTQFKNALHDAYSDLNPLEKRFAQALDRVGTPWCRNPSRSGYGIPLINVGPTANFYPDFLVWSGRNVLAIDTTAPHLLKDKIGRKLLAIQPADGQKDWLLVRFVSEGRYSEDVDQIDPDGFTIWGLRPDARLRTTYVDSIEDAVNGALT